MHQPSGRWRVGLTLTLIAVFMWGILPIALKLLSASMDAFTITWYRALIGATVLTGWLAYRGKLASISRLRGWQWLLLAVCIGGLCTNYVMYLLGLELITPSPAQLVIQIAPILFMIGAMVVFGERFNKRQWMGCALLVFGTLLFFHNRFEQLLAADAYARGVLMIMTAAVGWATYALAQKRLLAHLPSDVIMWSVYVGAIVIFLPAASPLQLGELDGVSLALLVFAAINALLAYGSFAEALAHWDATRVSAVLALAPLVTIVCMRLLERLWPGNIAAEGLDSLSIFGALLVVAGSMTAALSGPISVNNR